jgi:hypothetical protein
MRPTGDSTYSNGTVQIGVAHTERITIGDSNTYCTMPASRKRMGTEVSVISSATPQSLGLAFAYENGREYALKAHLFVDAYSSARGFKVGYATNGLTHIDNLIIQVSASDSFGDTTHFSQTFTDASVFYVGGEVDASYVEVMISLKTTIGGSGTLTLQGAQYGVDSSAAVVFKEGSFAIMEDITTL